MANEEHLAILRHGVEAWNAWRYANERVIPDLSNANLANADLSRAQLNYANLRDAVLRDADMYSANLIRADLWFARLTGANLCWADLRNADLTGADVNHARFDGAKFWYTTLGLLDLRNVYGLETAKHDGPSIIGVDTIVLSQGHIPDAFLKGAGVPDTLMAYVRSLAANPIEFYSCFISYSTKDQEFADRLYADLQANNVRCWFAPEDVQGGKKLHEQIDEAIKVYEKLLLILSPNSMSSEWVKTEIVKARKREAREKRRMLFPIRLVDFETLREWECFDADTGKDSAREICEYFVPDFSNWKDRYAYQKAFDRLLRDLRAASQAASSV